MGGWVGGWPRPRPKGSLRLYILTLLPVVRPGAPSSVLAPSSDARSP